MKQLVLDITADGPPTFDNFVAGANAELIETLRMLATRRHALPSPHLYLWGMPGSGRSHLLRAAVGLTEACGYPAHYFLAKDIGDCLPETANALIAVDDIEALAPAAQIALFNAFNRSHENAQSLVMAGEVSALGLTVMREDLRTRIGQSLLFEVRELDDPSRAAILASLARRRGLVLADGLIEFLLRHARRDLPSLVGIFDALDAASLEHKRPITLPLLRRLMQQGLEI